MGGASGLVVTIKWVGIIEGVLPSNEFLGLARRGRIQSYGYAAISMP
jgi:hypothetical protein